MITKKDLVWRIVSYIHFQYGLRVTKNQVREWLDKINFVLPKTQEDINNLNGEYSGSAKGVYYLYELIQDLGEYFLNDI